MISNNNIFKNEFNLYFEGFKSFEKWLDNGQFHWLDLDFAIERGGQKESLVALYAVLFGMSRLGHVCLSITDSGITPGLEELIQDESFRLEVQNLVVQEAREFLESRWVFREGSLYYLQKNRFFESRLLAHLKRLVSFQMEIPLVEQVKNEGLNALQFESLQKCLLTPLLLLSGGPGTGKTYTSAHIVKAFLNLNPKAQIVLAAPTGKAAAHLEAGVRSHVGDNGSIRAGTLHSLLEIRSSEDLLEEGGYLDGDLIIVDECSMIDLRLFAYLLASIKEGSHLVLMGDPDQLPCIESGSVFADLIQSAKDKNVLARVHLEECKRSEDPAILNLAKEIQSGNIECVLKNMGPLMLDWNLRARDVNPFYKFLRQHMDRRFTHSGSEKPDPKRALKELDEFRVISCIRQGPYGVDGVNEALKDLAEEGCRLGEWICYPVMITRNDYSLELFNGDTGIICSQKGMDAERIAYFWDKKGEVRTFSADVLPPYEFAYCLSVHKSQGSEYRKILLLIPPGSEVFGREVLYTAVTRARESLEIAGDTEIIAKAVAHSGRKASGIINRLYRT
jgi:exodeoxyribonuclease V alpha subunit